MLTLYELKQNTCFRCCYKAPYYIKNLFLMGVLAVLLGCHGSCPSRGCWLPRGSKRCGGFVCWAASSPLLGSFAAKISGRPKKIG